MWELHTCNNFHASSLRHLARPWDELHPPKDNTKKVDLLYMYMYINICMYICTHTHTHIYIYIYIYIFIKVIKNSRGKDKRKS